MQAKAPQLSQADQARAVLRAYVAAEEEEEGIEEGGAQQRNLKPPVRLPSSKGKVTLVTAARPQPQPFASKKRPAPVIAPASALKRPATSAATAAAAAAAPSPKMDPALAKYEAVEEEQGGGCPGVSVERRRKVIRELVLALTARGGGPANEAAALARAREEEGGWFSGARSKQEYQQLCRATLESLY